MRLTCPRCAAEYEIADSAIPAAGREVECSACSHVWHQPGAARANAANPAKTPARAGRSDAAGRAGDGAAGGLRDDGGFDPAARPLLSRPLDESVLSILREEAARELSARKGAAPGTDRAAGTGAAPAQQGDHNHATTTGPEATVTDATGPDPTLSTDAPHPDEAAVEWPATTVTAEDAQPVTGSGDEHAGPAAQLSPAQLPPAQPSTDTPETDLPSADPQQPTSMHAQDADAPLTPDDPAPDARGGAVSDGHDWPEPVSPALPDAAELAATLTRSGPALADTAAGGSDADDPGARPLPDRPLLRPALPDQTPATAGPDTPFVTAPPPPMARNAPEPPLAQRPRRGAGYASGFGVAAMLALGLVAVYALAPQIPAEQGGDLLAEWRQDIDRGRLWLHDTLFGR